MMQASRHDVAGLFEGKYGRPIVRLRSGAHLYGTAHAGSDHDMRGVFIPKPDAICTGRFPKSVVTPPNKEGEKNTPDSSDEHWLSLHHFVACALKGDTNALDWLHAPLEGENVLYAAETWCDLVGRKAEFFYSKRITGLVGYAQRQAAKYGIRGSRIEAMEKALAFLESAGDDRLSEVWHSSPGGEHIKRITTPDGRSGLQVCGKIMQGDAKASHYVPMLKRALAEYGRRAREAKENRGVDWKALSHALRAAYEFRRILTEGTYTFPLPEAEYLLAVKQGKHDFVGEVQPRLEALMDEVERLSADSALPDKPNEAAAYAWLAKVCRKEIAG